MDTANRIGFGALLALMLATGGALAQEAHEGPAGEGEEIALDGGDEAGWEGELDYADGGEEVGDTAGEDGWLDAVEPADWETDGGDVEEGVIVGEDLAEAEQGGPAGTGAQDEDRSEWSQGRLAWALRSLGGDRSEDASQDAPVRARGARVQPDRSVTSGGCASEEFRGALFCNLER